MPKADQGQLPFVPAPLPQAALDDAQRLACLRLIRSENVGPVTFRELINHFGGAGNALAALPELARRAGRQRQIRICPAGAAEAELEAAKRCGARSVFTIEPTYPAALAHVAVPPPLLYIKGRGELLNRPAVAIVGARNASAAGQKLTRHFATRLGEAGCVVVSGLARGIDGAAHEASLGTGTIAVLAGGIDFVYPPEHAELHERIGAEGCLVTEQPPGFRPRGQDFPRRNRIISGISLAVVIMEAARRSGTLTTARAANEQGRLVLAVPGHPLDPRSEGTNNLIREGATLVAALEDILEAIAPLVEGGRNEIRPPFHSGVRERDTHPAPIAEVTNEASICDQVMTVLGPAPVDLDEVVRATGLAPHKVRGAILELALAGLIEQHGQNLVSLADGPPPE